MAGAVSIMEMTNAQIDNWNCVFCKKASAQSERPPPHAPIRFLIKSELRPSCSRISISGVCAGLRVKWCIPFRQCPILIMLLHTDTYRWRVLRTQLVKNALSVVGRADGPISTPAACMPASLGDDSTMHSINSFATSCIPRMRSLFLIGWDALFSFLQIQSRDVPD